MFAHEEETRLSEQNIHFVPKTVETHREPEGVSRQTVIFHDGELWP